MSVQDDIFDLETELDNLSAEEYIKETFQSIIDYIGSLEAQNDELLKFYNSAADLAYAVDAVRERLRQKSS
jgi:hypothetical protein